MSQTSHGYVADWRNDPDTYSWFRIVLTNWHLFVLHNHRIRLLCCTNTVPPLLSSLPRVWQNLDWSKPRSFKRRSIVVSSAWIGCSVTASMGADGCWVYLIHALTLPLFAGSFCVCVCLCLRCVWLFSLKTFEIQITVCLRNVSHDFTSAGLFWQEVRLYSTALQYEQGSLTVWLVTSFNSVSILVIIYQCDCCWNTERSDESDWNLWRSHLFTEITGRGRTSTKAPPDSKWWSV